MNVLNSIKQELIYCSTEEGKLFEIENLINDGKLKIPCVIFLQTKDRIKQLYRIITKMGIRCDYLSSELTKIEREKKIK